MKVVEGTNVPIKMWTDHVPVEDEAMKQLQNISGLPFIHKHIAVMPDVHLGKGATVGSVIPMVNAIVPSAVGVDIGCGMMACLTNLTASDMPDTLAHIRFAIESAVPHGRTDNGGDNDRGAWSNPPQDLPDHMLTGLTQILDNAPKLSKASTRARKHLGTLGTGNHFIEICLDEKARIWIMLHSGSRGIGNAIGTHYINVAKEDMRKWFINLPDKELAYLPEGTDHFNEYVRAVNWAQNYAKLNREIMMKNTVSAISMKMGRKIITDMMAVNCHHNYVSKEKHYGENVWLTRKGAVSAKEGELGIIPGSMGAKSFIVRGVGNRESFCSCSHGAGRIMSRTAAKKLFTLEDHVQDTAGVECRKDAEVLDETPKAYKNIDDVMNSQDDLIEIVHTLKQILCVKG